MNPIEYLKNKNEIEKDEQIYLNKISNISKKSNKFGHAIYVLGSMGSGKTTFIKKKLKKKYDYFYLDYNDIVSEIEDAECFSSKDLYIRFTDISCKIIDFLVNNKISFIFEGFGNNKNILKLLDKLYENNYVIEGFLIRTELSSCVDRIKLKNSKSKFKKSILDVVNSFNTLWVDNVKKITNRFDKYEIIDNTNYIKYNTDNLQIVKDININDFLDENILLFDDCKLDFIVKKNKKFKKIEKYLKGFDLNRITFSLNYVEFNKDEYFMKKTWDTYCKNDGDFINYFIINGNGNIEKIKKRNLLFSSEFKDEHHVNIELEKYDTEYLPKNCLFRLNKNELLRGCENKHSGYIIIINIKAYLSEPKVKNKISKCSKVIVY